MVCGHGLVTLSLTINETLALIAAHLNAGHSGGDSVAICIYSPLPPPPYPLPSFSPSLISLMVSVDVEHHVYLQGATEVVATEFRSCVKQSDGRPGLPVPN